MTTTQTDSYDVAAAIGTVVADVLWTNWEGDETVTNVQIKRMADGSNRWAVFTSTYDADGGEHEYRVIFNADLTTDVRELS